MTKIALSEKKLKINRIPIRDENTLLNMYIKHQIMCKINTVLTGIFLCWILKFLYFDAFVVSL